MLALLAVASGSVQVSFSDAQALAAESQQNWTGKGSLLKEEIRQVIRTHIDEVRACYEKGLTTLPDLQGKVEVQFIVGEKGQVVSARKLTEDCLCYRPRRPQPPVDNTAKNLPAGSTLDRRRWTEVPRRTPRA
jgi:hypothetical protein